ncbi:MAG: cytochrome b/b6 domain-containing protein, partial [Chloroflexota bacterium]
WMTDGLHGLPSEAGRFNAGQKANAAFTVGSLLVFVGTGVIMTLNIFARILPDWLVGNASLIHDSLTWVALFAWLGHIFLAGIYPPTRESLRGMLTGFVRSDWARHHHPRWWAEQVAVLPPATADTATRDAPISPGRYNPPVS